MTARARGYVFATIGVGFTTALAFAVHALLAVPDVEMLFLLAVMIIAVFFGRGPSLLASALSVLAYDYFFVPPQYTFAVSNMRYLLTFAMMFGVGAALSSLATRLRDREAEARAREERTQALYALTRELAAAGSATAATAIAARHASLAFEGRAVVLLPDAAGRLVPQATRADAVDLNAVAFAVATWTFDHSVTAGKGTDQLASAPIVCVPIRVGEHSHGVLAINGDLSSEQRGFLELFAGQVAFALERGRLEHDASEAALRARTEELRASLLSSVSHDLRTPLAAVSGAASTLRDVPGLDARTREELLGTIYEETERLERLVANLLDMTRLGSGAVAPRRDWVPIDEMVGAALHRIDKRLAGRPVTTHVQPDAPLVSVDPILIGQMLFNLLDNAVKHTPAASPIEVYAAASTTELVLEVADRGPGLHPGDEERVFERFTRGANAAAPGAGLGLPICRAIAVAHGGTLLASNRPGGGAVFRAALPLQGHPPSIAEEET